MSPRKRTASRRRAGEFTCPECGRTFTGAAALGAHRRQAHGIAGTSSAAVRSRGQTATSRRKSSTSTTSRKTTAASKTATTRRTGASRSRKTSAPPKAAAARGANRPRKRRAGRATTTRPGAIVNRDSLLKSLFPNGIPAREDAIQRVNEWLDEAEQLARMR
jgi:hypothetical protein